MVTSVILNQIENASIKISDTNRQQATFTADAVGLFEYILASGGLVSKGGEISDSGLALDIGQNANPTGGMKQGSSPPKDGFVAIYLLAQKDFYDGQALVAVDAAEYSKIPISLDKIGTYTLSTLISVWRVADSKLVPGIQKGRSIYIEPTLVSSSNPPALQEINDKDFGRFATLNPYSLDKIVPLNTKTVSGYFTAKNDKESGAYQLALAGSSEGMGIQVFAGTLVHTTKSTADIVYFSFKDLTLLEAQTLYGELTNTSLTTSPEDEQLFITGYTI